MFESCPVDYKITRGQGDNKMEIETLNKYGVASSCSWIVLLLPPKRGEPLTEDDALLLAAWLVAVTGKKEKFDKVFAAVCST